MIFLMNMYMRKRLDENVDENIWGDIFDENINEKM